MSNKRSPRWWPFLLILALSTAVILFAQMRETEDYQSTIQMTSAAVVLGLLFSLLWAMFFSRFTWKRKFKILGVTAIIVLASIGLFRIRGFDGNFIPIPEFRWQGAVSSAAATARADTTGWYSDHDYPRFLGSRGDAIIRGVALKTDWETSKPKLVWKQPIGEGWSGFALTGKYAIVQEQRNEAELISCYEIATGKKVWEHADEERFESTVAGNGPRATPAIVADRVFTTGSTGLLNCLDLKSGREIWSKNVIKENDAVVTTWGFSRSPIPMDSLILVSAGGNNENSLIAYDQASGDVIWSGGDDAASYSSPVVANLAGIRQVVVLNRAVVTGHSAQDGAVLWRFPFTEGKPPCISQPLAIGNDQIFVSVGYGEGCGLYKIRKSAGGYTADEIWKTPRLKSKFSNVIHYGEYLYGLDDGTLVCLDLQDGQRKWKKGRYGHGQLLLFGDNLLILSEKGELVIVKASPEAHQELARIEALDGKTWNTPAFSTPYLLMRNDREAACYKLPLRPQASAPVTAAVRMGE